MSKKRHKNTEKKLFTSPGSLIYVGKEVAQNTTVKLIEFNPNYLNEKIVRAMNECKIDSSDDKVVWLDVDGIHETGVLEAIGKHYHLHPLLLEDVLNTEQKAKLEHFEDDKYLFVILKMLRIDENDQIEPEHIALILGFDYVISLQEQHTPDIFKPILERLKTSVGKTRKGKADYLMYSLMDLVVDNYFAILEHFSEHLEDLEAQVIDNPSPKVQADLYELKRELTIMRKAVLPLRDIFGLLIREDSPLIRKETEVYLRDLHDHVVQVLETIDSYREMMDNILNIYLASLSNKMNSVMKTLTVFTAIFMPLTFIAGIYGMNFDNMPELHSRDGYFFTIAGMVLIGIVLWAYFRWKKYI
jgi:magnesium transporter